MKILKKLALAASSCALALSPVFAGGAWAITKADIEDEIGENDEVFEFDIDLTNGKSFSFDGLSAECLKAVFEEEDLTVAYVTYDEEADDYALATDADGALFEITVDGDNVSAKSVIAADADYPVQILADTLFFGCPVAIDQTGAKRIATEFFNIPDGQGDTPILVGDPDDLPGYQYVDLWVFATIRYGNEDNPDTFDATNYFLIMLGACVIPFGLMCLSLRSRRNKR